MFLHERFPMVCEYLLEFLASDELHTREAGEALSAIAEEKARRNLHSASGYDNISFHMSAENKQPLESRHVTTRRLLKARESVLGTAEDLVVEGKVGEALAHIVAVDKLTGLANRKRQTRPLANDLLRSPKKLIP